MTPARMYIVMYSIAQPVQYSLPLFNVQCLSTLNNYFETGGIFFTSGDVRISFLTTVPVASVVNQLPNQGREPPRHGDWRWLGRA